MLEAFDAIETEGRRLRSLDDLDGEDPAFEVQLVGRVLRVMMLNHHVLHVDEDADDVGIDERRALRLRRTGRGDAEPAAVELVFNGQTARGTMSRTHVHRPIALLG